MEMQPGDVLVTSADTSRLDQWVGFEPKTNIKKWGKKFVDWYLRVM